MRAPAGFIVVRRRSRSHRLTQQRLREQQRLLHAALSTIERLSENYITIVGITLGVILSCAEAQRAGAARS